MRYQSPTGTRYYIRDIQHLYLVGQLLPTMPIPRPTSRKNIGSVLKARLQIAAFRLMRQDPLHRLRLETLAKLFPDFTEQQIRQKVREFSVYVGGYWRLRNGMSLPTEDALRKLLGPESACLHEAMLVGEQRLRDAGVSENVNEDEEETLELDAQLAPWTLTHNFLLASQSKCMLALHGEGDPTILGEGFSMIKTSMKEVFLRAGETIEDRSRKLNDMI